MTRLAGLMLALIAFWLAMSGLFTPVHLAFGALSILITLIIAYRLDILDSESAPYGRVFAFAGYMVWLIGQIAASNWRVARACLAAHLDIEPALVILRTSAKTDLGRVAFANSITLTPGTVTVDLDGDKLLVHALHENESLPEGFASMDQRATRAAEGRGAKA